MSQDILDLLLEPEMTRICAPMVRYSKLQFRMLVRRYDCDICYTPMILADSFIKSHKARDSDFTTNKIDHPLIVQFAANNSDDFVEASELVSQYSNGVGLNCGCPQRWAMKDGYGADLLNKPQLVKDLIYRVRNRIAKPFTVSVKIRILNDLKKSVELAKNIEHAGASFLTIHGRTPDMKNEPIHLESLKTVSESVQIPVVANGGVKSLDDAYKLYDEVKCNGIMVAGGILTNPALFAGYQSTPLKCIQDWLDITHSISTNFMTMHHHLVFMLEKVLAKKERLIFNNLQDRESVYEFLENKFHIKPTILKDDYELIECQYKIQAKRKNRLEKNFEDVYNIGLDNLFI